MKQSEESSPIDVVARKITTIRSAMDLISLMDLVTISVSEKNPVFLLIGAVVAVIFLRFGKRRNCGRHGGTVFGRDDDDYGG